MIVEHFIKPGKLVEYFDSKVRESLDEKRLYSIEGYGWLNADDTDPDYDGYAKWHTEPRVEYDFDAFFNRKPFTVKPENIDIEMVSIGHDFMEVMKAAWLMLGQAIFFQEHSKEKVDLEFTYVSLNLISAIVQLNLASDRIRDLFFIAVTGKGPGRSDVNFSKIAKDASKKAGSDQDLAVLTQGIAELSERIFPNRRLRNDLVHELASNNAIFQRQLLREQQEFHQTVSEHAKCNSEKKFQYLENNLEKTINCYRDLIEVGNLVFKYEYLVRVRT
ncbi:hypothetical protein LH51_15080 [Nitrincola sp. A-D6]|uniref:hypothetical protein n=1 Tax=Nitrincola sp. A-D6 TaxID=1545442 RepID=UPI00051FD8EE|nr:hypothetical protein [Nitrincola sp. A-D6]KGK41397.1 hypothetical protein LH51_15080 [Nitrincola sp. A-D6]